MSRQLINLITQDTETLIKSAGTTEHLEFVDGDDNPIPTGIPYHIHITSDKSYWYMTSNEHETNSILIFKADGNDPSFVRYRKLYGSNRQTYLYESRYVPTKIDYRQGSIQLHFAKPANDTSAKVFEISQEDFNKTTQNYLKTQINFIIKGERNDVETRNQRLIDVRDLQLPGLKEILQPLRFFQPSKPTKEDVIERLEGFVQERVEGATTPTAPATTTTTSTTSYSGGGSSGGSSGGGGGGGYS